MLPDPPFPPSVPESAPFPPPEPPEPTGTALALGEPWPPPELVIELKTEFAPGLAAVVFVGPPAAPPAPTVIGYDVTETGKAATHPVKGAGPAE